MLCKKSYLHGCNDADVIGYVEKTGYVRSGSRWTVTHETVREEMTAEMYCNIVDAVEFFRGIGGKEIVERGYTRHGYIPVKIHSISPSRDAKTIYKFRIY